MKIGMVKFVNNQKRFGFIESFTDPKDEFFSANDIVGKRILMKGDIVSYTVVPSKHKANSTCAVDVQLVRGNPCPPVK